MFGYAFILSLGLLANPLASQNALDDYCFETSSELSYNSVFIKGTTEIDINNSSFDKSNFGFSVGFMIKI
jgi:hypothetical protein